MELMFRRAVFDHDVLALDEARFLQALTEGGHEVHSVSERGVPQEPDHRHRRLLRVRRERPGCRRAAECDQQLPPSDGDCHTPLPCEVRKENDTTPRACCPTSAALGAGEHFPSSRRCEKMLTRAVFSEGDAARPTTASQPPERACKTSKHYRSRLARPLLSKHYRSRWQGRSCLRLLQ